MFGPIRNVVFDLDGTLVNTMPSVVQGLKKAVETSLGHSVAESELVASFGPAPLGVLRKWMPEEKVPAALEIWLSFEHALGPEHMTPFTGVAELLEGLREEGIPMLLFTGRDREGTTRILKHNGWLGKYFPADGLLCGDDGFPTKPSSEGLIALLQRAGFDPAKTLMVGDHPADMVAGRGAGTKTAAALWDLPPGQGTDRSRFRQGWMKWDGVPADVRLIEPSSLLRWITEGV